MIYIDKNISSFDLAEAMNMLSAERREKMEAISNEAVRRQGIAAYLLLCKALREEYGITEPPTFGYEDGGKPFILARPYIHFNLSHCSEAVICAVSDRPVGVDIETVRPFKDALARHVLSEEEYHKVVAAPSSALEFIKLWTRKEALLKLTGEGIRTNLKTIFPREDINIKTTTDDNIVYSVVEWLV